MNKATKWWQPEKTPWGLIIIIIVIIISIVQNSIFHDSETTWSTQFQCPQPASSLGGGTIPQPSCQLRGFNWPSVWMKEASKRRVFYAHSALNGHLWPAFRGRLAPFCAFERTHAKDRNIIASTHARSDNTKSWRQTSFSRLVTMAQVSWSKRWIRPEASYCSSFSSDFFWFMFFLRSFFPHSSGAGGGLCLVFSICGTTQEPML